MDIIKNIGANGLKILSLAFLLSSCLIEEGQGRSFTAQELKIQDYYNPSAFISPWELAELLSNQGETPLVLGLLNPLRFGIDLPGGIESSYTLWYEGYGRIEGGQEGLALFLIQVGAQADSTIVVYSSKNYHDAAWLWWEVRRLGYRDVRFLDGGLEAWVKAGYPLGPPRGPMVGPLQKASSWEARPLAEATRSLVEGVLEEGDTLILDVRTFGEHYGYAQPPGAFGPGAIPGSQLLSWHEAVGPGGILKSRQELEDIYKDVLRWDRVIVYSQWGIRSAHTALVLKEILGMKGVYNYSGSWADWSQGHYQEKVLPVINDELGTKN